jgi:hypothetical protein
MSKIGKQVNINNIVAYSLKSYESLLPRAFDSGASSNPGLDDDTV